MTRAIPPPIDRRRLLCGGAALGLSSLAASPGRGLAATGPAEESLGALAAAKGLRFGASFATHELDAPYGPAYSELYAREARMITSELELKLFTLRPDALTLDFAPADRLLAYAQESDLALHGHTLVWNDGLPDWMKRLSPGEIRHLLDAHLMSVLERYRDGIPTWDVVNEPIAPWDRLPGNLRGGAFYEAMGEDYIAQSFRLAREYAPRCKLILNEAQTESDDENGRVFRESFLALVKRLTSEGVPIDGIGLECHLDTKRPYDFPRFAAYIEELATLVPDIAISEFDVNDRSLPDDIAQRDVAVADIYRRFLGAVLAVKAVRRLTLWQLADHTSWMYYDDARENPASGRRPRPLPFDDRFQPKRARAAIAEALAAMPAR